MSKLCKVFMIIIVIFLVSGCSYTAKEDENGQPKSEANVTINKLYKTNDTTPSFSGTYNSYINFSLGISIDVGGAQYKIYPINSANNGTWDIDLEVPNVKTANFTDISKQTTGTLDLSRDGNYTITVKVEDENGATYKDEMTFEIDTTTDAIVTLDNIERRLDKKPKLTGTASNVHDGIKIDISNASYVVYADINNTWELDTKITQPNVGNLDLSEKKFYTVKINASDIDGNEINEINSSFLPGLLEINSAYYWDWGDNNVTDHIMFISFNRTVSSGSFVAPHLIYNLEGTGLIGTSSDDSYSFSNNFSVHRIWLDETSQIVSLNETNISIKPSTIEDSLGYAPDDNNTPQTFKLFNMYAYISSGDKTCVKYNVENAVLQITEVSCSDTDAAHTEGYIDANQSQYIDQDFLAEIISGDNIVKDKIAGLIWEDNNSSLYNYTDAINYCENMVYGGYQDWRLPNMTELQSIIDRDNLNILASSTFATLINDDNSYWSRDAYIIDTDKQWGIDFNTGMTIYKNKSIESYVKCVRRER